MLEYIRLRIENLNGRLRKTAVGNLAAMVQGSHIVLDKQAQNGAVSLLPTFMASEMRGERRKVVA